MTRFQPFTCLLALGLLPAQAPDSARYVDGMNRALDRVIGTLRTAPGRPLVFSANLDFAHREYMKYCSLDVLTAYVDGLKAAGAKRVDINPGLWPWSPQDRENMAKYDALVRHIREVGLQLAWNPSFWPEDAHVTSLADWEKVALPVYAEMARRYQPDIFSVIHEPTTMNQRMHIQASPDEWRQLATKAARVVKQASPRTRAAAGSLQWEMPYFQEFVTIPDLDVVTVDIYFLKGLSNFAAMARIAHQQGKDIYIEETWRFTVLKEAAAGGARRRDVSNQAFEDLDIKWLEAMVLFANKYGMSAITPFWSTALFTYLPQSMDAADRRFFKAVSDNIKRGTRTRYFQKYRELAQQYGR